MLLFFRFKGAYDIGLIKLKTPLKLNNQVAALSLPQKHSEPTGDVVFAGWGVVKDSMGNPFDPKVLQVAHMSIVERNECNRAVKKIGIEDGEPIMDIIHETNVCTGPLPSGITACNVSVNASDAGLLVANV